MYGSSEVSYAESAFDNSPLNQVIEQGNVGYHWQLGMQTIKSTWESNVDNEVHNLQGSGYYPKKTLYKNQVTDENGIKSWTFTDRLGRTIMTEREIGTSTAQTYYQYDQFGRVEKVYPPKASVQIGNTNWQSAVADLIYEYTYDQRGRVVIKKIPGADEQYIVYDRLDRVVLTQDGNQRTNGNEWTFTKYDILNRPVMTGIYHNPNGDNRTTLKGNVKSHVELYEKPADASSSVNIEGYTSVAFPNATSDYFVHSVSYYDDYDYDGDGTDNITTDPTHLNGAVYAHLHGKLTGTRVRVLDGNITTPTWLSTFTFYDKRGRVIQLYAENHMGGKRRYFQSI